MKMCKMIFPCILLLSVVMADVDALSTETATKASTETEIWSTAVASTVVMDTSVVSSQVADAPGLTEMTTVEAVTSNVATTAMSSLVAPGNIKTTKFLYSSQTPEAHTKVEQNITLGHENISVIALTSEKTFSSSTVKTNRESTFFFKSTARQLTSEDNLSMRLTNQTSEPVTMASADALSTVTAMKAGVETVASSTATAMKAGMETDAPSSVTATKASTETEIWSTVVMDTSVVSSQVADGPGLTEMATVEAVTSNVATTTMSSPVAPGNIKTTKFLPSSQAPEAHTKVEQNITLGHENISVIALTSEKTFSSSTVKTNRESTFFFKSTARQLTSEDNLSMRLTNQTSEPEKEQKSSALVIGLSIFFVTLLLIIIAITVCCIWKKSKKSTFDLHSVDATLPLHPIETKEPSSGREKK